MIKKTRMKSHRRWVKSVAVAAAVLVILDVGMRVADARTGPPSTWPSSAMEAKYEQLRDLAAHNREPDVVFVGSSAVFEGIDAAAYSAAAGGDVTAYNAALGGASMISIERWTIDIVVNLAEPQTVVIGVIGRDINDNGIGQQAYFERLIASQDYAAARRGNASNPADSIAGWLNDHWALWRMRPYLRQPITFARDVFRGGVAQPPTVGAQGAELESLYQFEYLFDEDWRAFWTKRQLHDYSVGGREAAALRSLVDQLIDRNIQVVLVSMPVTDDYVDLLPDPANQAEFEELLTELAPRPGLIYIDGRSIAASTDLFRDPAHLNPTGARRLAEALAKASPSRATAASGAGG